MFGIEFTRGQKIQIGIVVLVLVAAGFIFFRNTRTPADMTINSWVEQRNHTGLDPRLPVSAKNPADPSKATVVTVFACHDGRLEITEYTPESGDKPTLTFIPDRHRLTYDAWKDPWARVHAISDPYKHMLTFAAYSAADNHPQRILGRVDLTKEQLADEKVARQTMMDNVTLIEQGQKSGSFRPEMYDKVLTALAAYKARPGDPMKDPAKAQLARKVVDLAMDYIGRMETEKAAAIDKYVAAIDAILKAEQKTKLAEVNTKQFANRQRGPRARAG